MPEGHTVHRLARDLNSTLRPGPVGASSPQGLFADGAAQLDGAELDRARAYGKHLFLDFAGRPSLHIHLGLIGKLRRKEPEAPIAGEIRLRLQNERATCDLTGPMVCALGDPYHFAEVTEGLGPDPLRRDASGSEFGVRLRQRSIMLAAALLDQNVIAGLGNVYRSELCFLAGLDPRTPAKEVSATQADELWNLAVEQLRLGVRLNRIVTRDPAEVGRTVGRIVDEDRLYVYNRGGLPCHRCGDSITMVEIAQRKAWYCPTCQT